MTELPVSEDLLHEAPATDMHTHLAPLLPDDADIRRGGDRYCIDDRTIGPPGLYDPDALRTHLRVNEIDRAAVSIPPPFFRQGLTADRCQDWTVAVNRGLLAATAEHDELIALAYLPLDHPEIACAQYVRLREDPCWAGYVGSAGGGSVPLDDPALDPLWTEMDVDGALLLLHPGVCPDQRLQRHYLANLLGNPVETAVAAAQLVFGAVPYRWPGVRFLLAHCGGAMPALAGRWQRGHDTGRPGIDPLDLPPAEAVRRFWVDSLAHDSAALDLAAHVVGDDRIVLGSDWPFPMGVHDVRSTVGHLNATTRTRIATRNAAVLLST